MSEEIYQIWYTESPGQSEDHVRTFMTLTQFQGHEDHLKWFPLNIWRNIWHSLTKFCTQKHQSKEQVRTCWPWSYFEGHLRWFPLNVWRNIWHSLTTFGTFVTLTTFKGQEVHIKWFPLNIWKKIFDATSPYGRDQVLTCWPLAY